MQARVNVPDDRFRWLADLYKPKSSVPAFLDVVDIAGLVKCAPCICTRLLPLSLLVSTCPFILISACPQIGRDHHIMPRRNIDASDCVASSASEQQG